MPGSIIVMPAENLTLYAIWDPAIIDSTIFIAAYNDAGALISVSSYVNDSHAQGLIDGLINDGAAKIRAFLWSKEFVPLSEPADVYPRPKDR